MVKKIKLFDSDSLKVLHRRVFFSITVFIFVFFISIYRISSIMIFPSIIDEKNSITASNLRGDIYDRNGNILATSIESKSISFNPKKITNKKELSSKLASILNLDLKILEKKMLSNKNFEWIKRNITPKEYQQIINLGEININSHIEYKRIYPYKNVSSHVVGYVNIDQKGQAGIERYFDDQLSKSEEISISLDINLQQVVREHLNDTINFYRANSGLAIVMEIDNGQILSSVSLPDYNPQKNSSFNHNNLINRVFQSNYEMGSTFKPITATMGFDFGIINSGTKFDVTRKFLNIGDYHKFKGDGIYDIEKIIVESSNIGTAQMATLIGKKNQKEFFNKIGFNDRVILENKESAIPLGNKNNWGKVETATIGYGHGFSITPLHLVKAYATLSNKGIEVFPTLQLNKKNAKKIVLKNKKSSDFFLSLLKSVVLKTEYTGPRVRIEGYEVGGKTGTSDLVNPMGGYYKKRNLTSFIAVFPIDNPKYVIYTALEYPKKEKGTNQKMTGGRVNAPLVKKIIISMINLFNIPKKNKNELLKVDINFLYREFDATI